MDELADSIELLVQPDIGDDIDGAAAIDDAAAEIDGAVVASPELFIEFGTGTRLKEGK